MKKYFICFIGSFWFFSATTVYAQELTEKEKERQEKEAKNRLKRMPRKKLN